MKVDPGLTGRLIEQEAQFGVRGGHPLDLVCTRGEGIYLWDVQGNRYMDFLGARGAVNQGHTHTRIATAMVEQCLRLPLPSRSLRHDRLPPFLEKLCKLTGFEAALLLSDGAGAVQAALQVASRWAYRVKGVETGKAEFLVFTGNLRLPFMAGLRRLPYGDLAAARAALGPHTCGILVEPVLGGEVRVPPRGFLRGLRDLCDGEGLLLLADEVQSGLGRTGRFLAMEHEGVRPDGVVLGRSLSGGFYPVSAFLTSRSLLDLHPAGPSGGAFAGSPLACATASAALDVLVEERLADRSAELGAYFLARLRAMESPRVKEIRGLGLWAGLEVREEDPGLLVAGLAAEGLLCEVGPEGVLELAPPLVITREQLDWALERLERVLGR
jgi:ornithine--oxo-acid transaminase